MSGVDGASTGGFSAYNPQAPGWDSVLFPSGSLNLENLGGTSLQIRSMASAPPLIDNAEMTSLKFNRAKGETLATSQTRSKSRQPSTGQAHMDTLTRTPVGETLVGDTAAQPKAQQRSTSTTVSSNSTTASTNDTGRFTVDANGQVSVEYLFDGGKFQGQLALFSLNGMEALQPGSQAFIKEAARRALTNSTLGRIIVDDAQEGAKFSGILPGEPQNWNNGNFLGTKTYTMQPGDTLALMLIPDGKVQEAFNNPAISGSKKPLFSWVTANTSQSIGQIADLLGDGSTFAFEDTSTYDRDYNDIIFRIKGAIGQAPLVDTLINPAKEWRNTALGQQILNYARGELKLALVGDSVAENSLGATVVGQFNTTGFQPGDQYSYSLLNSAGGRFQIVGNQLQVSPEARLDFEAVTTYTIQVQSTNSVGQSTTRDFTISITNVNEAPSFVSRPITTAQDGSPYHYEVVAIDPDAGDVLKISASFLPNGVTLIESSNGRALLQGNLALGNYDLELVVTDAGGLSSTQSFIIGAELSLTEANRFNTSRSLPLTIPTTPSMLSFKVSPQFDHNAQKAINDAFEVALVNAAGDPLVYPFNQGRDAFFNLSEGELAAVSTGATYDATTGMVSLNLVGVQANQPAFLVFRLVNNDGDITSQVAISDFKITVAPIGTVAPTQGGEPNRTFRSGDRPNFAQLQDVTPSLRPEYYHTSFHSDTKLLYADVAIRNVGTYSTDAPLLIAIKNVTDPTVQVQDADGVTPDGLPYYDFSQLVASGKLEPDGSSGERSLIFHNPNEVQFGYELVVLSHLNQAPLIQSKPVVEVIGGKPYRYEVKASDPNQDVLSYQLTEAPAGMVIDPQTGVISWETTNVPIGAYLVGVEVSDGRGGFDLQHFSLAVLETPPNRPPIFTSTPNVDAHIGQPYQYDADATDPDGDPLRYSLDLAPEGMTIDSNSGEIRWIPPAIQVLGDTVLGQIRTPGEQNTFTFSGIAGQVLYYDAINGNSNLLLSLESPSGRLILDPSRTDTTYEGPITLSETGNYRLTIRGRGDATGNYGFSLIDQNVTPIAPFDTDISGTLQPGDEADIYRFEGKAGQRLYLDKLSGSNYQWTLYYPNYYPEHPNNNNRVHSSGNDIELVLPVDGIYSLALQGQGSLTTRSEYTFRIITPETTTVFLPELGTNADPKTISGEILEKGEQDIYTFTGQVGQRLYLDRIATERDFGVQLVSPSGQIAYNSSLQTSDTAPITLIEAGTYQLVIDGRAEDRGSYSFNLLNASAAEPVTLNLNQAGQLELAGETHLYEIQGVAGQRLYFDFLSNNGVAWTLHSPANQRIQSASNSDFEYTLEDAGTYILAVLNTASVARDYQFQVVTPATHLKSLTLGVTETQTLQSKGDLYIYTFEGATNQRLLLDSLLNTSNVQVQLTGPSGGTNLLDTSLINDRGRTPVRLIESGTYQLTVKGSYEFQGDFSFRLLSLTPATTLSSGTMQLGSLDPGSEIDLYEFQGTAGDQLYLQSLQASSSAEWLLYGPGNQVLNRNTLSGDFESKLPTTGTYTLLIRRTDNGTGAVEYRIQPVASTPKVHVLSDSDLLLGNIIDSQVLQTSISQIGEQTTYQFQGVIGQRLYFDAISGNDKIAATLYNSSGKAIFTGKTHQDGLPITLTEAGAYHLVVDGVDRAVGNYQFRLVDLAAVETLSSNSPQQATLAPQSTVLYRINGSQGQTLQFVNQTAASGATWSLYAPGSLPSGSSVVGSTTLNQNLKVLLPVTGTYILALQNASNAAIAHEFQLTSSAIPSGINTGFNTVYSGNVNGQSVQQAFTTTAGTLIYFDSQASYDDSRGVSVELLAPDNTRALSTAAWQDTNVTQLSQTGTYTLKVTGSGKYRYQLLDLGQSQSLVLNQRITAILNPESTIAYQFNGTLGQQLYFDSLVDLSRSINAQVKLISPSGRLISSHSIRSDSSANLLMLEETGQYHLLISSADATASTADFRLLDRASALSPTSTQQQLDSRQSTRLYHFSGQTGQTAYIDSLQGGSNNDWTIYGPDGTAITSRQLSSDLEVVLPANGDYLLAVQGERDSSVNYQFNLSISDAFTPISLDNRQDQNIVIQGAISQAGEQDSYTFTGAAGQRLFLDNISQEYYISARLLSPSGIQRFDASASNNQGIFTLHESGTYQLIFDGIGNQTGQYQFRLLDVVNVTPLSLDEVETRTVAPRQTELFKFEGKAGQYIYFSNDTATGNWVIYKPDNGTIQPSSQGGDREWYLPTDGVYILALNGSSTLTSFTFQIVTPEIQTLPLNTPTVGEIREFGEQDIYHFEGTVGQQLSLDLLTGNYYFTAKIYSPSGNLVYNGNLESEKVPFTLIEAGSYRLIIDGYQRQTGPYSFRLLDLADPNTTQFLQLDTPVQVNAKQANEQSIYRFTGVAGQQLFFDRTGDWSNNTNWTLYGSANQTIASANSYSSLPDLEVTLPGTGAYTLILSGDTNQTRTETFQFQVVTPEFITQAINLGQTITNGIQESGERDTYTFEGTAGQWLYFDGISSAQNLNFQLISSSGATVFSHFASNQLDDLAPFYISETGTYQIVVNGRGDATGNYSFALNDLASATEVTLDPATTTSFSNQTIDPSRKTNLYRLHGDVGQRLYLDLTETRLRDATWRLYGADNQVLNYKGYFADLYEDIELVLPKSGDYILAVSGEGNQPVNYSFQVVTTEADTTPLVLGQTISQSLSKAGEQDVYTFQGQVGQRLFFDAIAGTNQTATLFDPNHQTVFSNSATSDAAPLTLTQAGTYRLVIDGTGEAVGNYRFQLADLTQVTPLQFGESASGQLNSGRETALYTFNGKAGQQVTFDLNAPSWSGARWSLFNSGNTPVISASSGDFTTILRSDGTYVLAIQGSSNSAVSYQFQATATMPVPIATQGLGTLQQGNLVAGQSYTHTFEAAAGTVIYIDSQAQTYGSALLDIRQPNGQSLLGTYSSPNGVNLSADAGPLLLSQSGTYTVQVSGSGSFKYQILEMPKTLIDDKTIEANGLTQGSLAPRAAHIYTLQGKVGQQLFFDGMTNDSNYVTASLYSPAGQVIRTFDTSRDSDTPLTLTEAGAYQVLLNNHSSSSAASFGFRFLDIQDAALLPLNQRFSDQLTAANATKLYQFDGKAGQSFFFNALSETGGYGTVWTLYGSSGQKVSSIFGYGDREFSLPTDGTYTLAVRNDYNSRPQYSFQLLTPQSKTAVVIPGIGEGSSSADELGVYRVQVNVADGKGGQAQQSYKLRVGADLNNHDPGIISTPVTRFALDETVYRYQVQGLDPDDDALTYSIKQAPIGAVINSTTGELTWYPANGVGKYDFTVQVNDGRGGIGTQTFSVDVTTALASIRGTAWNDLNGNGILDTKLVQGNDPDVVFVIDVSGSTQGSTVDWTQANLEQIYSRSLTILDTEKAAVVALSEQLKQLGRSDTQVGIVLFSGFASILDVDPATPGTQVLTTVDADRDGKNGRDIVQVLTFGADGGTNFTPGLEKARDIFQAAATTRGNANVIFLSDGYGDLDPAIVSQLSEQGVNLKAFGIGDGAGLDKLQLIDPDAIRILSAQDIINIFSGKDGRYLVEPTLPNIQVYLDLNDNGVLDAGEPNQLTRRDDLTTAIDESGQYSFDNLLPGSYVVRQNIPAGYRQTAPDEAYRVTATTKGELFDYKNFGSQKFEEIPNRKPTLVNSVPAFITGGQSLVYQLTATDPDPDVLKFDLTVKPEGMAISETGMLIWTPKADQIGQRFDGIVRVQDGRGGIDLQAFQIEVKSPNHAPIFTSVLPAHAHPQLGKPFSYQAQATDVDGDVLHYNLVTAIPGASLTSEGLLSWRPTQLGLQTLQIRATDGKGGEAIQTLDLIAGDVQPNRAPVITSQPREIARPDTAYLYKIDAADADGDRLSYSLDSDSIARGMKLENNVLTWNPDATHSGIHPVILTVSDGQGGATEQHFRVQIQNRINNLAPEIISVPNLVTPIEQQYHYNLIGTDPDGDLLLWNLDKAPDGMVIDPLSGALRWQPRADQIGQHEVSVRAIDALGAYTGQSFTLIVNGSNLAPQIQSVPITRAAQGQGYQYAVVAVDPENGGLRFSLERQPNGMTISEGGVIEWTPTAAQIGTHTIEVVVSDPAGDSTRQRYELVVGITAINHVPVITSQAVRLVDASNPQGYRYQVQASDPDGNPLTYKLLTPPDGMSIDAAGLITWATPTVDNHQIAVAVEDGQSGVVQSFTLVSRTNAAPVIEAIAPTTMVLGNSYRADVIARDVDRDKLSYSIDSISRDKGITIDAWGKVRWIPTQAQIGTHSITVTVSDALGAVDTETIQLTVATDTQAPKVNLVASATQVNKGTEVTLWAQATDNVGIQNLQLTLGGQQIVLDASGQATVRLNQVGTIAAVAQASDASGNSSQSAQLDLIVFDPTAAFNPNLAFDLPDVVTAATQFNVGGEGVVGYKLEVAPVGTEDWQTLTQKQGNIAAHEQATFDPSLLQNDTYIARLTLLGANGGSTFIEDAVSVAGDLKLGNFRLSFTDLAVPVTGIPITLTRTYDSITAGTSDDFGYGWRMEFRDTDLRTSLGRDLQFEEYGIRSQAFDDKSRVYITLPGGKREGFTFKPKRVESIDGQPLGLFAKYMLVPEFVADKGSTSTLTVEQSYITRGSNGKYYGFNGSGYNPADAESGFGGVYVLTTKDGTKYRIDAASGDLLTVTDTNGNTLSYSDSSISSSTGKTVTFARDAKGRITSVQDPEGELLRYSYDANGDLISVTDRENNGTRMVYDATYDDPAYPGADDAGRVRRNHFLRQIVDPLGRTGARTEYDDNGRLKQLVDVNGKAVVMTYDTGNDRQVVKDQLGNETVYVYDNRGNVLQEIDVEGKITNRKYDVNNWVTEETVISDRSDNPNTVELEGYAMKYTYDAQGNKLTETNHLNQTTYYTYGDKSRLLSETDALGRTTQYAYDSNGNLTNTKDANGIITNYTYDATGQLKELVDANGKATSFTYTRSGDVKTVKDAQGNVTDYTYNSRGDKLSETQYRKRADGTIESLTTTWTYDSEGLMKTMTNAIGDTTAYGYDKLGQQVWMLDARGYLNESKYNDKGELVETGSSDGTVYRYNATTDRLEVVQAGDPSRRQIMTMTYDEAGRKVTETDALGRTTKFVYDKVGRLTETLHPDLTPDDWTDNPTTKTEYYSDGLVKAQIDERGNRTEYRYDEVGRQIALIAADKTPHDLSDNPTTRYTYDKAGQQQTVTDALGQVTTYQYDDLGRMVRTVYADQTFTTQEYDKLGRRTAVVDPNGNQTEYRYDELGRLTGVKDALEQWTEYGYNEQGQLIWQEDANDHRTRYEYDKLGRRVAVVLPLNQRSSMAYDEVGNLKTMTDFNGKTITYHYDEQNRLRQKQFQDGSKVEYHYTHNGLQDTVTFRDGVGLITSLYDYDYDVRDRLTKRTDVLGTGATQTTRTIEYGYDAASNQTSVTTASGITTYIYDERNRLDLVKLNGQLQADYDYDAVNRLTKTTFGNGTEETRIYDSLNRLKELSSSRLSDNVLPSKYIYTFDKVGNRMSAIETVNGQQRGIIYTYDELYRLAGEVITDAVNGNRASSYAYDKVGNRFSKTVNGTITTYEYDKNDRLLNEKVNNTTTVEYSYDNNGSTTQKVENGVTTTYVWNDEKRLIQANVNGTQVEYSYNDQGIRVFSNQNGVETRYLLDEGIVANVWEEYSPDGTVQITYNYGNDLITQTQDAQTNYYLVDGLGSTRLLTDAQGQVLNSYGYEAFGQIVSQTKTVDSKYQYAGEQFDETLGNYYLRQRFYDTSSGRFGRMDDYEGKLGEPTTLQKYLYANGSPTNYSDPTGYYSVQEGNWVHNIIGAHFIQQAGVRLGYPLNPRNSSGLFTEPRVFDPRFPLDVINIVASGSRNRPTFGRVVRTALQSPNHPGVPGINGKVPDLVDFSSKEFYEIKPNNVRGIQDGQQELQTLNGGFQTVGLSAWGRGNIYAPLSPFVLPNSNIVLTHYHSSGLIVYDIFNTRLALTVTYLTARVLQAAFAELIAAIAAASARPSAAFGV